MGEVSAGVFVVTLEGVENDAPPPLTILAFVKAEGEPAAEAVAAQEAARDGFTQVRALRTAEVLNPDAMPEDFRAALANAHRYGSWLIVYDEP